MWVRVWEGSAHFSHSRTQAYEGSISICGYPGKGSCLEVTLISTHFVGQDIWLCGHRHIAGGKCDATMCWKFCWIGIMISTMNIIKNIAFVECVLCARRGLRTSYTLFHLVFPIVREYIAYYPHSPSDKMKAWKGFSSSTLYFENFSNLQDSWKNKKMNNCVSFTRIHQLLIYCHICVLLHSHILFLFNWGVYSKLQTLALYSWIFKLYFWEQDILIYNQNTINTTKLCNFVIIMSSIF